MLHCGFVRPKLTIALVLWLLTMSCHREPTALAGNCSPDCEPLPPPDICGDGTKTDDEDCDDGNVFDGDGCSARCEREPRCGDGIEEPTEECDDGNSEAGDGCSASCETETPDS